MKPLILGLLLLLGACQHAPVAAPAAPGAFFARLSALCGQRFAGRIDSPPTPADAAFVGQALTMHVRDCSADEIRIPFHVGSDRSRTWVVTRQDDSLRLKHDHRHADGTQDDLSQYGGDATIPGTASRQEFPADAFSKAMFLRRDTPQSVPNVWAMEVKPGRAFTYELARPGRLFRVTFDLSRPLPAAQASP